MLRKRLLASCGALLASAGLSVAQNPNPIPGWGYAPVQPAYVQPMPNYGYVVPQIVPVAMMPAAPAIELPSVAGPSIAQPLPTTMVQAAPAQPEVIPPPAGAAPAPVAAPAVAMPALTDPGSGVFTDGNGGGNASRFWVSSEYLLWWLASAPLPIPLVTTGPVAFNFIGLPTTDVLYGAHPQGFGPASGGRVSAGWWIDPGRTYGIEASGFLLETKTAGFHAQSNAAGIPALGVPVFVVGPGAGENVFFTTAGPAPGNISIQNSIRLWGWDTRGALNVVRQGSWDVDLLLGFSSLHLSESFSLTNVAANTVLIEQDRFSTSNRFYGGELGGRVGYRTGSLSINLVQAVSLGSTSETSDIFGNITVVPTNTTFPGGLFAELTNGGHHVKNDFTVVSQTTLTMGYDLARSLRATLGYDFLYWSRVMRPGDQLNRNVNISQQFSGTLVGPAQPTFPNHTTDFIAHGIHAGLEFRY